MSRASTHSTLRTLRTALVGNPEVSRQYPQTWPVHHPLICTNQLSGWLFIFIMLKTTKEQSLQHPHPVGFPLLQTMSHSLSLSLPPWPPPLSTVAPCYKWDQLKLIGRLRSLWDSMHLMCRRAAGRVRLFFSGMWWMSFCLFVGKRSSKQSEQTWYLFIRANGSAVTYLHR